MCIELGRDGRTPKGGKNPGKNTMEQNRSLIIILSVTFILIVFFGIGLWLFYPQRDGAQQIASTDTLVEYLRGGSGDQGDLNEDTLRNGTSSSVNLQEQDPQGMTGPEDQAADTTEAGSAQEPSLVTKGGEFEIIYGVRPQASATAGSEAGREPTPSTRTGLETDALESPRSPAQQQGTTPAPAQRSPARELGASSQESQGATSTARTSGRQSSSAAPAAGTAESRRVSDSGKAQDSGQQRAQLTEYWIQVISSPSRDRVEQVYEELKSHGLGGRITTKLIDTTTYYRLRFGPYSAKPEAEKFLAWIRAIPEFSESYISLEYRQ